MRVRAALVAIVLMFANAPALGQDVEGSADHALVGRFSGSSIIYYRSSAYDAAALLQAPHDYGALLERNAVSDRTGPEWLAATGAVTQIRYQIPAGHGALEVSESYRAALEAKGFTILFACEDAACFTGALTDDYLLGQQLDTENADTTRYGTNLHYFLAALGAGTQPADAALPAMGPGSPDLAEGGPGAQEMVQDPAGFDAPADPGGPGSPTDMGGQAMDLGGPGSPVTQMGGPGTDPNDPCADPVNLACGMTPDAPAAPDTSMPVAAPAVTYVAILAGEDGPLTTAFVEVVEPASGQTDLVDNVGVVDAQNMASALDASGSINLYSLHFDTGSALLKPDSRPTIEQIFQLLQAQPQLRLAIIGHTDNQGSAAYNMDLSARRAQSVVTALVRDYGIAPDRLTPSGLGYTQPVASNDTPEGRAQNRRVELKSLSAGAAANRTATVAVDTTVYDRPAGAEIGYLRAGDPVTISSCDDIG